ncbi:MAG: universal stress protein [Pseudomonadota bacterium]
MYKKLLVPIVFDDDHDTQASFKAALTLADSDAAYTVMHVLNAIPAFAASEVPDALLTKMADKTSKDLEAAAEALPGADTVLVSGHAGRQIVNHATSHENDCIVIASHVPGLENVFLGSTADWVVRHAKCAVHVIR